MFGYGATFLCLEKKGATIEDERGENCQNLKIHTHKINANMWTISSPTLPSSDKLAKAITIVKKARVTLNSEQSTDSSKLFHQSFLTRVDYLRRSSDCLPFDKAQYSRLISWRLHTPTSFPSFHLTDLFKWMHISPLKVFFFFFTSQHANHKTSASETTGTWCWSCLCSFLLKGKHLSGVFEPAISLVTTMCITT